MSFTGATAGYSAGAQANDVIVAIAAETEYGTAPAGAYQRLRLTGETFRCQRTRQRPEELESSWEANAAVSVQQSVNGSLSGAVSFGAYDELLACVCGSSLEDVTVRMPTDVRPNVAPAAWAGGKMLIATAGQNIWGGLAPCGFLRLVSAVDKLDVIFPYTTRGNDFVTPTADSFPTALGLLDGGTVGVCNQIVNGTTFRSLTFLEYLAGSVLTRTGGFVSQIQFTMGQGQFAALTADVNFRDERRLATTPASEITPAAPAFVIDPVSGWGNLWIDGVLLDARVRQFQLTLSRDGSGQDYAMGQLAAAGQRAGSFMAAGQIQLFFRDFTQYQQFESSWQGLIQVLLRDRSGNAYGLTWGNASLQNPQINAGSKNSTVVATFDIEGNPNAGNGTFCLNTFPAEINP